MKRADQSSQSERLTMSKAARCSPGQVEGARRALLRHKQAVGLTGVEAGELADMLGIGREVQV